MSSPSVNFSAVAPPVAAPAAAYAPRRAPLARKGSASDAPPPDLRAVPTHAALELSVAELIELYFAHHPCSHMSGAFKKWIGWFQLGELSAWSMTADRLRAGAEYLRGTKNYAISTVNRELSQLGSIYKWAIAQRHAPAGFVSPTLGPAGRLSEPARYVEPPKPGELERIRKLARGFRDAKFTLFVWLLLDTGARRGELSERRWTDFDLDAPEGPSVILTADQTKTGRARRLYFSADTAALLRRLRPGAEKYRKALVFTSARSTQPNGYRKPWARLTELLGRPGLHVHDLRHMIAADLLNAGKGMSQVASLLGHSSLVLHRRYGHLDDAGVRAIQADRLGLDKPVVEFEPVSAARERHAERQAANVPMAEAERLALLAQDAAAAAANAAVALAAAQDAMRVAMGGTPALPVVERMG